MNNFIASVNLLLCEYQYSSSFNLKFIPCEHCLINTEVYNEMKLVYDSNIEWNDHIIHIQSIKQLYHVLLHVHQQDIYNRILLYRLTTIDLVVLKAIAMTVLDQSLSHYGHYISQICTDTLKARYVY